MYQLVGFFIDGLASDYLKMKVMREKPDRLQAAVQIAMSEQNLRKWFNLRAGLDDHHRGDPKGVSYVID